MNGLTYPNVMSTIAVFVALGGGAYAVTLPRGSVGAREIERNAVRASEISAKGFRKELRRADLPPIGAADITDSSLTGAEIADSSLQSGDLAPGAVGAAAIADGAITRADLGFGVAGREDFGFNAGESAAATTVTKDDGFRTVVSTSLTTAGAGSRLLVLGAVQATNPAAPGSPPAELELRVVLDGDHVHPLTFRESIEGGSTGSAPVSLQCNEVPAGTHTVELQARVLGGGSLTVGSRSVDAIRFGPIFHPPG